MDRLRLTPKTPAFSGARAGLRELQEIPGVGPCMARDLLSLGIHRVADLRGRSPEALCARLEKRLGTRVDPCVLYVFRCAVYFAEAKRPDSELLKWWNWKDSGRRPAGRGSLRR